MMSQAGEEFNPAKYAIYFLHTALLFSQLREIQTTRKCCFNECQTSTIKLHLS